MFKWFNKKAETTGDSITLSDILLQMLRLNDIQNNLNDHLLKRIEALEDQVETLSKLFIERKMDK